MVRTTLFGIPLIVLFALLVVAAPALAECADTDPANDIYVQGTVTLADGTVYTDGCPTSSTGIMVGQEVPRTPAEKVAEFFCDDGTVTSGGDVSCTGTGACVRQVTCPGIGVCTDGACVAGEPYCTDTDDGRDYGMKGEVTSSSPLPNSPANRDSCSGEKTLFEYYCEGVPAPAGGGGTDIRMAWGSHAADAGYVDAIWVEQYTCPGRCADGACVEGCPEAAVPSCREGTSPKKVLDSSGCTSYECAPVGTAGCTDSDGGKDYFRKGEVTLISGENVHDIQDYCDAAVSDGVSKTLHEFYCAGSIAVGEEGYACPEGCKDGACAGSGSTGCPERIPEIPPCAEGSVMEKYYDSNGCHIGYTCTSPEKKPTLERGCAQDGKLCAGIAGITCCEGLTCSIDSRANYPDASGTCVKLPDERIPCSKYLSEKTCALSGGSYVSCPSMCQEKSVEVVAPGALAKCLAEKGAVAYIASSCPFCEKLASLFGDSWGAIKKVECRFLDATGGEDCAAKGIVGYPTWVFADGSSLTGLTSLNDIAKRADCPLPESSTGTAAVSCIRVCGQSYCQCERDKVYCEDDPYNSECVCRSGERVVEYETPQCKEGQPCIQLARPRFSCVEGHEQDIVKARLDEPFKLAAPQAAIIVDYNGMQVKLTALDYGKRMAQPRPLPASEAVTVESAASVAATSAGGAGGGASAVTGQAVEGAESMIPTGFDIVAHLVVTMPGSRKLVLAQQSTKTEIARITGRIVGDSASSATASVATAEIAPSAVQVLKLRQGESATVFGVTLTVKELTKGSGVFVVSRGEGVVCPESKTCEDGTVLKCWQEGDGCGCESCPDVIRCKSTFCPDGSEVGCSWDGQACACKPCPVEQRPVCGNGACEDGEGLMCKAIDHQIAADESVCYVACPEDCGKETPSECDGCVSGTRCLPYGSRRIVEDASVYCDFEGQWQQQLPDEEACQNDYECATNSCTSGKCADLEKEIAGLRATVQKLLDFIGRIFG